MHVKRRQGQWEREQKGQKVYKAQRDEDEKERTRTGKKNAGKLRGDRRKKEMNERRKRRVTKRGSGRYGW